MLEKLDKDVDDQRAVNEALDREVSTQRTEVSRRELDLINMVCDNEAAESKLKGLQHRLLAMQVTPLPSVH